MSPLTTAQHIDRAKAELATGGTDYAIAHAVVALAEIGAAWLITTGFDFGDPEPIVDWPQPDEPFCPRCAKPDSTKAHRPGCEAVR